MSETYSWYRGSKKAVIRLRGKRRDVDLGPELAPKAPQPPYLISLSEAEDGEHQATWVNTCKGAYPYRCGYCQLCLWEEKANRWAAVAPWYAPARLDKPASAPRWPNIHAAIRSLAEHELYGRAPKSPIGEILDNLRRGAIRLRRAGTTYRRDREDPVMARASEIAWVDRAIHHAYQGNRWGLQIEECKSLLLSCTDGVLPRIPKLSELEAQTRLPAALCRAVVRYGRRLITIELAARRLVPMPPRQLGLHDSVDILRRKKGWPI